MPDFAAKINKQQEQLATGEVCESAVVTKATIRVGASFGLVGALASVANDKRKERKHEASNTDGLATQVPQAQLIAGVTNQRLVFFSLGNFSPKAWM